MIKVYVILSLISTESIYIFFFAELTTNYLIVFVKSQSYDYLMPLWAEIQSWISQMVSVSTKACRAWHIQLNTQHDA